MPFGRRNFLQTLFASPGAIALANERERVRTEQEVLAKSALPAVPKARCEICDQVLISGKCQNTEACGWCRSLLIDKIRSEGQRHVNHELILYKGKNWAINELYELRIFTHWVEDKCIVCGNGQFPNFMSSGGHPYPMSSSCAYIGTAASFDPDDYYRTRTRRM